MNNNKEILKKIKEHYGRKIAKNVRLTSGIDFIKISDDFVLIRLSAQNAQEKNMQDNKVAFEGWALAIHVATGANISLDIEGSFTYEHYEGNGHFGRFLYRAMRFSEQYPWFSIYGDYLKKEIEKFKAFISVHENTFINNIGEKEAGIKQQHNDENIVEAKMAEPGCLKNVIGASFDIGSNGVFRQLPVGLFKNNVSDENAVFTGGKSAIDLWTWNNSTFTVIELKTQNKMVGIITEIFFYANYMRDLLLKNGIFNLNKDIQQETEDRGYSNILKNKDSFKAICGIMLADEFHPLVNQEIVDAMNKGTESMISYVMASYKYDLVIKGNN